MVVVSGSRPVRIGNGHALSQEWGISLYAPMIVKYRDDKTDLGAALEELLHCRNGKGCGFSPPAISVLQKKSLDQAKLDRSPFIGLEISGIRGAPGPDIRTWETTNLNLRPKWKREQLLSLRSSRADRLRSIELLEVRLKARRQVGRRLVVAFLVGP